MPTKKIVFEFKPSELTAILKEHLLQQGYQVEGKVEYVVKEQFSGFGSGDYPEHEFRGATVTVVEK